MVQNIFKIDSPKSVVSTKLMIKKVDVNLQMRFIVLITLFALGYNLSHAQNVLLKADPTFQVDKSAEFPGGINAFRNYLADNLLYPARATIKGKEGRVFVQFIVDETGRIDSSSVNILAGFDADCDQEARRVIRECRIRWKPAVKDSKNVKQRFVLPLTFKLPIDQTLKQYMQKLSDLSVTTVLVNKPGNPKVRNWQVYSDLSLTRPSGYFSPGDTVEVIGWGPRLVAVQRGYRTGYISWLAIKVTKELEPVMKMIEEDSPAFEKEMTRLDSIRLTSIPNRSKTDKQLSVRPRPISGNASMYFSTFPAGKNAFLALRTSKKKIVVGECAVIDLAFYISAENKVPLQFYDLPRQMMDIRNHQLKKESAWISSNNLFDIEPEPFEPDSSYYTMYKLFSESYCPTKVAPLSFDPITLEFYKLNAELDTTYTIIPFKSLPLTIQVLPLPTSTFLPTKAESYSLVGQFEVSDSVHVSEVKSKQAIPYSITLQGNGLTFPIEAPIFTLDNVNAQLLSILHSDTIINNVYQSAKTFSYSLIFDKPGYYDFSKAIKFVAYNPLIKKAESHFSKRKLQVSDTGVDEFTHQVTQNYFYKNNIIALDASQSMMIEDYDPNRLGFVKQSLIEFFGNRKKCDIGMILFGAEAIQYNLKLHDSCYAPSLINQINFDLVPVGTAIGNAIWHAINSTTTTGVNKKIVIIGDGDNTAGNMSIEMAIDMARNRGIKVYTIGVGNTGLVPFGKDFYGTPNMVSDTFSDSDFKKIAVATGGKYYWAKDKELLITSLIEIFGE